MIGRSLRTTLDFAALGERTLIVDCDVIQADGGTRTAAITGGFVAVALALRRLRQAGKLETTPIRRAVAAVSVGVFDGEPVLDLCYEEDSRAEVDCNVVMTDAGELVEVQSTAERAPFPRQTLDDMLSLAEKGIRQLLRAQSVVIES
jgi:ribonuclease PH